MPRDLALLYFDFDSADADTTCCLCCSVVVSVLPVLQVLTGGPRIFSESLYFQFFLLETIELSFSSGSSTQQ